MEFLVVFASTAVTAPSVVLGAVLYMILFEVLIPVHQETKRPSGPPQRIHHESCTEWVVSARGTREPCRLSPGHDGLHAPAKP